MRRKQKILLIAYQVCTSQSFVLSQPILKKKKKSDPKKYPPLEQFLHPLSVGSTCLAALRFKAVFIFRG